VEGKGRGLIFKLHTNNRLEGLRKATKTQDMRYPGRDLNPGPHQYEAGVLTT
jgi:hypothetical protein